MPRLSMNELTTYRWSFDEDLLHFQRAGYDGIGVWLRKLRDFGEERAVELVRESRLHVACVGWEGGFTGADAASAAENLASAQDSLALCGRLRAGCLVLHSGGRNGHTKRHAERLLRSALDSLLPYAEANRVPLAIEPMHPACAGEWTLLTSLGATLDLMRAYDSPWLRVALDTYHFPVGETETETLAQLAPHVAVVHVGDVAGPHGVDHARAPLGEGDAPLATTLGVLLDAGYDGFLDVKLLGPEVESLGYADLLSGSREYLSNVAGQPAAGVAVGDAAFGQDDPGRPPCATRW